MPKPRPEDEAKAEVKGTGTPATDNANATEKAPDAPAVEDKGAGETPVDVQVHLDKIEELEKAVEAKDKAIEEAEKKASDTAEELVVANAKIEELDGLLATANETIETLNKAPKAPAVDKPIEGDANLAEIAVVAETEVKLVTVKFLKDHSFSFGMKDVRAVKGDKKDVDIATANKLSSRGLAILLN